MKRSEKHFIRQATAYLSVVFLVLLGTLKVSAHCDSFAGPVIKEAMVALRTNNVALVYKWINPTDEAGITKLFDKTYRLRNADKEVYEIAERHFLETLVRLHRASEHAPYTGLKSADSVEPIVRMSDEAIETDDIDGLLTKLNAHIAKVIREKYARMKALEKTKDHSAEQGREYVRAYVDYVHTVQGVHSMIDGTAGGSCPAGGTKVTGSGC